MVFGVLFVRSLLGYASTRVFAGLLDGGAWEISLWGAVPLCIIWIIWKERNQRTLEGIEHSPMELKLFLLRSLYDWMAASSGHSFFI